MFNVLGKFNLQFKYSNREGVEKTIPVNLLSIFPPNQMQPIFDFEDWEMPIENVKNVTSFGDFFNKLEVSIVSNPELPEMTEVTIFYETSPGVILEKNV